METARETTLHDLANTLDGAVITLGTVVETLHAMNERMDGIDARLVSTARSAEGIDRKVTEMHDDLHAALIAIDSDSVKILDHERRIRRLEKSAA